MIRPFSSRKNSHSSLSFLDILGIHITSDLHTMSPVEITCKTITPILARIRCSFPGRKWTFFFAVKHFFHANDVLIPCSILRAKNGSKIAVQKTTLALQQAEIAVEKVRIGVYNKQAFGTNVYNILLYNLPLLYREI